MTCIAWMYHTLLEYLLVSIFLTCQVFFFSLHPLFSFSDYISVCPQTTPFLPSASLRVALSLWTHYQSTQLHGTLFF